MRKALFMVLLALIPAVAGVGRTNRNLLTERYSRADVYKFCDYNLDWVKYPAYSDRAAWDAVPGAIRQATIEAGEKYIGYDWPNILPTMYLEFTRTGDRNVIDVAIAKRLSALRSLFFAELMEGKGRFLDDIINGVFTYCEQTYWGMSAAFYLYEYDERVSAQSHPETKLPDASNPVIDLTVGDVSSTLSWIWYFLHDEFDKVSPVISDRLERELRKKVLEPYYSKNDLWWITGWNRGNVNNWTPWCSYNVLTTILLLETDKEKRIDGIYKTMQSVDLFINSYPEDGGCSEGPNYWGHAVGCLFDYLNILNDFSSGAINIFDQNIIGEMGRYIYKLYISNGVNFVNFSDSPARINQDGTRIARYGRCVQDPELEAFGEFLEDSHKGIDMSLVFLNEYYGTGDIGQYKKFAIAGDVGHSLSNIFDHKRTVEPKEMLVGETFLPNLQVAVGRDEAGTNKGFFFAAKGGNNGEQHNHNDVGSFILYYDGKPVFVDPGVGTYTRETFSADRYKIWTMQSGYHNLPIINGTMQNAGGKFKSGEPSFKSSSGQVSFSADIAGAFPKEAGVSSWIRKYTLKRKKSFSVEDSYSLVSQDKETEIVFMTPLDCEDQGGRLLLKGDGFDIKMSYLSSKLTCRIEEVGLDDPKIANVWGKSLNRVVFTVNGNKTSDKISFEVFSINRQ